MIELPDGWVETTLEKNIVDIAMGPFGSNLKVDSFISEGVPVIKGSNLYENFVSGNFSYVSEGKADSLKRSIAYPGDIIITHRGTLGQASLVPEGKYERYVTSQSQLRFTVNENSLDKTYLLYFLKSRLGQYELLINSSQVGVPAIATPTKAIKQIRLSLPPLSEQKSIAKILSSFDEKIELLREQNEILETLAQTIFKEWFVNFNYPDSTGEMVDSELGEIPKGWRVGSLLDIFELVGGGTPKTANKEYWSGNIPWYSVVDVPKGSNSFVIDTEKHISEIGLNNSSTKLLRKGTTIVSARGSVGKLAIVGQEMAMNQSCYGLNGKNDCGDYYVFFQVKEILNTLKNNVHGAVFDTITTSTFASIKVPIPTPLLFNNFEISIMPIMEKILNNIYQIQTLTKTRDTLLPKLMRGEIRVSI